MLNPDRFRFILAPKCWGDLPIAADLVWDVVRARAPDPELATEASGAPPS